LFFVARKEPGYLEPVIEHIHVGEEEMEKAVDVIHNLLLENAQALFLAVCWSTLADIDTFSFFPEKLNVDTSFSTNKEKDPLLVGAGKENITSNFSYFQCFGVSPLLNRDGYLNLLLDTRSLHCWGRKILEDFNKSILTETHQSILLWKL
jgi:hypothetical protein